MMPSGNCPGCGKFHRCLECVEVCDVCNTPLISEDRPKPNSCSLEDIYGLALKCI